MPPAKPPLAGLSVLIVEDDCIIATDLSETLHMAGAQVIGPAPTISDAIRLIDEDGIDAAVVDFRLGAETTNLIALQLAEKSIPYFFHSGSCEEVLKVFPGTKIIKKPSRPDEIVEAVLMCTDQRTGR